jgi:gamma-glutamylcyclotransferase (GGCT)/AIG2-like uncharacterized protein YtfP
MPNITLTITTKKAQLFGLLSLLVIAGVFIFLFLELIDIRRDLYAIRSDYYGVSTEQSGTVDYVVLAQETKTLPVLDEMASFNKDTYDPVYTDQEVIEVQVEITNNQNWVYSYYGGTLTASSADGVLRYALTVETDDESTEATPKGYESFDLAPGGQSTVTVYFPAEVGTITQLYDQNSGTFIQVPTGSPD